MTLLKAVAPMGILAIVLIGCISVVDSICVHIHWILQIVLFLVFYMFFAYMFRFKAVNDTKFILLRLLKNKN